MLRRSGRDGGSSTGAPTLISPRWMLSTARRSAGVLRNSSSRLVSPARTDSVSRTPARTTATTAASIAVAMSAGPVQRRPPSAVAMRVRCSTSGACRASASLVMHRGVPRWAPSRTNAYSTTATCAGSARRGSTSLKKTFGIAVAWARAGNPAKGAGAGVPRAAALTPSPLRPASGLRSARGGCGSAARPGRSARCGAWRRSASSGPPGRWRPARGTPIRRG